jgi:hypothetical protein
MTFPVDDLFSTDIPDGFVKVPLLSQGQAYCGAFRGHVPIPLGLGTPCGKVSPHVPDASSGFARLACGHFKKPSHFYDF